MIDHGTDRLEQMHSGIVVLFAVICLLAIYAVVVAFLGYTAPGPPAVGPGSALSDFQQPGGVQPPAAALPEAPGAAQEANMPSATIVSITAYITDADLSDNQASAGVYNAAGDLLGVTIGKGGGEMTGGGEWVTFLFATPLDVSDVEQVRLAVFGNYEEVGYAAPGPDVSFDTNAVYTGVGSWPAHVDPPEEFGWFEENKVFSIYATGGNGAKIGTESSSETGFYTEGEKVCASGLLDTAPLVEEAESGSAAGPLFTGGGML